MVLDRAIAAKEMQNMSNKLIRQVKQMTRGRLFEGSTVVESNADGEGLATGQI